MLLTELGGWAVKKSNQLGPSSPPRPEGNEVNKYGNKVDRSERGEKGTNLSKVGVLGR